MEKFCKWQYETSTSYQANIPCRNKIMNIKSMRYYTYCPYCGNKIQIFESNGEILKSKK